MSATVQEQIHDTLVDALQPVHLDVINESHQHNVPDGSESHFKVVVVTDAFKELKLLQRHQKVNALLKDFLEGSVHALSMFTHTPEEWVARGQVVPDSPPCRGGSKR